MITALQKCDAITEGSREAMGSGEESTKEVRQCWGYRSGTIRDVPVAGREGMPACSARARMEPCASGATSLKVGLADGGAQSVPKLPEWVHLAGGLDDERDGEVAVLQCSTGGSTGGQRMRQQVRVGC